MFSKTTRSWVLGKVILKIPRRKQRGIFDPNGDESICIRASKPRPKGRGMQRACVFNSSKKAFRYFSPHCWARKQTTFQTGSPASISRRATFRSPSAFSTHSSVSGFIKDDPSGKDFRGEDSFSFQRSL